jgi:formamidopyrimidine-DNA glycosylase
MGHKKKKKNVSEKFIKNMRRHQNSMVKPAILDQSVIAAIGNIYADEALFKAGIRPDRPANTLNDDEVGALNQAIKDVLLSGIENRGTTFRDYRDGYNQSGNNQNFLQVYGRTNQTCFICGESIKVMRIGGRGTHYCSQCQH